MKKIVLNKNKFLLVLIVVASLMLCTLGITSANKISAEAKTLASTNIYSPTKGNPGEMTVINELKTAFMPIGHALYIYGGGWNDGSDGKPVADYDACEEAKTIGVPEIWSNFYLTQDSSFSPWDNEQFDFEVNPTCVHWGLDCSGYLGWVLQNITNKPHGFNVETYGPAADGWVGYAQEAGYALEHLGMGTRIINPAADLPDQTEDPYTNTTIKNNPQYYWRPGDIYTYGGNGEYHCWICIGRCLTDGSVLLVHSSEPGVFICGTAENYDEDHPLDCDSDALKIARTYMKRYYTDFYNKFGVRGKPGNLTSDLKFSGYLKYTEFKWNNDATGMTDAQGLRNMSPEEIMATIFEEVNAQASYTNQGPAANLKFNDALVEPTTEPTPSVYNLNDKPDKSVVEISLELPQGYKFDSLKINNNEYVTSVEKNSAVAKISVPRNTEENYTIYTASSVVTPDPVPIVTETAATGDFSEMIFLILIAVFTMALFTLLVVIQVKFYENSKNAISKHGCRKCSN